MSPSDKEKIMYEQDKESYRHQNSLKWSRFKMIYTVEAAILYVVFKLQIETWPRRSFMIFGSLLVALLCLVTLRDRLDARMFLKRILEFEGEPRLEVPSWGNRLSGHRLIWASFVFLWVFNILVIVFTW